MSASRSQFTWSPSSFLTGVAVTLDLSTILSAYVLWSKLCTARHRDASATSASGARARYYYLILGLIALAHSCDMCLRTAVTALTITDKVSKDTGDFVYRDLTPGTLAMNLVSLMLAWIGGVGFVGLNVVRFRAIARARMPGVTRIVSGLAGVSVAVCSVNNILFAYGFIGLYKYGEASSYPRFMESLNRLFSGWSIYDSVINALISLAFVTYLQRMLLFLQPTLSDTTTTSSSTSHLTSAAVPAAPALAVAPPLAKSHSSTTFAHLLRRITWILGFECSAMIASNIFVQVAPTLDPLWNSIYLSESIRLRLFCTFFVLLNRMVGESRQASHKLGTTRDEDEEAMAVAAAGFGPKMATTPASAAATGRPSAVTIPLMPMGGVNVPTGNSVSVVASAHDAPMEAAFKGPQHVGRHGEATRGGSVLDQAARRVYGM
ncbi:hypothetical protein BCR44DRAFT_33820 [Catenaria anguillulae PL171]|uniref:Uncharacterized protein n=1 Tax=Catenaria anguillulae PL171 TaxID=765915 RepID=A0A1Y2HN00_9FUNG|nr:hypothetical protein BCR44DRAFT_33820 [Catenaria anguillulae PL171]